MANPIIPKKQPVRQCLGCNAHKPKVELIRVVRAPDGSVSLDFKGKKSGRGAYLCRDGKCLRKVRKSGRLSRSLEVEIPDAVWDEMQAQLDADAGTGS